MKKKRVTRDALDIIHHRFFEGKPERLAELEIARENARIARTIYELRSKAGLSQCGLANLAVTSPSTIAGIEDDDFESLSMCLLRRIAAALNRRVEVCFPPARAKS